MNKPQDTDSLNRTRFVGGAAWMVALRWLMRIIGLVSTIILARLLTPQDFGLVAMAMVIYALVDSMATTGVDLALIRDPGHSLKLHNAAWTIQIFQGIFIAAIMLLSIPFAISYFSEERLQAVLSILALTALIQGFRNIGTVAFRKELDFAKEFRFIIYQKLTVFVITVSLAFWLRDYRAMVIGMLSQALIEVALSYRMHEYRPKISTSGMREIWSFSQWLLISRIGMVLNEKAGQLVAGRSVGTELLGVYHIGVELGTIFVHEIVMPARRALFPNMSRLQGDPDFSDRALEIVGILFLACIPVGFGLYIVAEPVVRLLLGERWLGAVPVLSWMAIFGAITGVNLALDLVLLVKKRANFSARKAWFEVCVLIPVLIYASAAGNIEHIAMARVGVAFCFVPMMIYYSALSLEVSAVAIYSVLWRPVLAGTAMVYVDHLVFGSASLSLLSGLFLKIAVGALVYIACLWLIRNRDSGPESIVVDYLGPRLTTLLHRR